MGFLSGSISFRRFYIEGPLARECDDEMCGKLAAHAFGKHGYETTDGIESGWVTPAHIFDTDFSSTEKFAMGPFLHLGFRLDRTGAPANVVKAYRLMEEKTMLEESGREFLSKKERRLAKEAAVRRAELEARQGNFRRSAAYPVLIDLEHRQIYLGNNSSAVGDRFMQLLKETLGISLTPADSQEVAYRIAALRGDQRSFEDAEPSYFVDCPIEEHTTPFDGTDRNFLGWEFLTWLWYVLEVREGQVSISDQESISVTFARNLHLSCCFELSGSDSILNDAPVRSPEAKAALTIGKTPRRAGFLIASRAGEWQVNLDGPRFTCSGLVIPALEEGDALAIAEHRFLQMRLFSEALDALYGAFLKQRLTPAWGSEFAAMKHWVQSLKSGDVRTRASA
ncbi:MAG: hypothetical protein ACPGXK_12310 [Phycisphaerae bacterium]